ncbi:A/G-specific adenine glycosylase [Prosthecomicrobium hirschii]|uniref:A/G-specific adenine glycosylase n=1 Tax=Prosthecodimorpha hirschii TaxID=665126 RepID=UPI001128BA53|nr:A/G-specific adenine glycosylase [Prosthecomicrobium hirschii]TPQ48813.1 A/G-specific adenine glycosylase [Prosthecomicrobium hirschii]
MTTRPDSAALLAWYDRHHRRLPWRIGPADRAAGAKPDPYRIWLSEVMLQQTTVTAVKPYFEAFLARWPRVCDLAAADEAEVMKAWAGLGYYSRARNLKACADAVAERHGGRFPDTEAALLALPGIGAYTAAAIAAIAFDRPATVVDGNVERVVSRLFTVEEPLPDAKPALKRLAATLTPQRRAGDFAQAMMDLGATLCTPRKPACPLCPWSEACRGRAAGAPETYPRKRAKAERPTRRGIAYVAMRSDGAVLLRRRPPKGLLGGMSEVPSTDWTPAAAVPAESPPLPGPWAAAGRIEHTFTHFHLILEVRLARRPAGDPAPDGFWWSTAADLAGEALPSVMRKVVGAAQKAFGS